MARVTLAEVARHAGVSSGAASYALNGRPGVSASTRARVLAVAAELRWAPNAAARRLSANHADTLGLVVARTASTLASEPFFMQLIAGMERVMALRGCDLLLRVVADAEAETACHQGWAAQARVDGVVLVDLRTRDPRPAALVDLELPAVAAGHPALAGGLPSVWNDDESAAAAVVHALADLGHRRLARVAGPADLGHVALRAAAASAAAGERGVGLEVVATDLTGRAGAAATAALLERPALSRPTAVVYENDLMAVAGLTAARATGLDVPADVSLVAGDDSVLCTLTHPALTAVGHDVPAYGSLLAEHLFALVDGQDVGDVMASVPALVVRRSSGPPPGRR